MAGDEWIGWPPLYSPRHWRRLFERDLLRGEFYS
jgi:hypothetical protein